MSRSRSRSPDTIDIEMDPASRNVRARLSPISGDPYMAGPSHAHEHTDSSEEPFEDPSEEPFEDASEEPFEDEVASHSTLHRSPSPLPSPSPSSPIAPPSSIPPLSPIAPSSSAPPPSPLPPASPPTPAAPPSPVAPPTPVCPSLRFSTRTEGTYLRWDWMPTLLHWWRLAERLPFLPSSFCPIDGTPIPALTAESAHHTIPIVVARLRTHDEQLEDIEHGAEELQQQFAGVEGDLSELRDEVVDTYMRQQDDREEIHALRQEVATLRQGMAEMRAEMDRLRADVASSSR